MKKADVQLGKAYLVKVSGLRVPVRIVGVSRYGGWDGVNLCTRRAVRIKSAQRLRKMMTEQAAEFLAASRSGYYANPALVDAAEAEKAAERLQATPFGACH